MPILRSQRTYPLSLTAAAINTGIVAAWDWAGDPANARAGGNGVDHTGNGRNWTPPTTAAPVVANIGGVTGMDGRDPSVGKTQANNFFSSANLATLGLSFGTGAYSGWLRFRVPTATPVANNPYFFARVRNAAGSTVLYLGYYEVTNTSKYHPRILTAESTVLVEWSTVGNSGVVPGGIVDVYITRSATGTVKAYINGVKLATASGNTADWSAGGAVSTSNFRGTSGAALADVVHVDESWWSRELSEAEIAAHAADPYAGYTNAAPANGVTITTPAGGATIGTSVTISGTYSGGGAPAAIEGSFNGGAFSALTGATISGGSYSGTLSGLASGTGNLVVRWANDTGVTATAAGVTVAAASIAFAPPAIAAGDPYARANRILQRNGSNQAAARLVGTYSGTVTAIEYRWRGGSWASLVASPSGGAFDATVTLTGPGQGALEVRFANATGVVASLANVGVGDVYICAGQSNHVGMANTAQVTAVAPGANPGWVTTELDLTNAWRQNVETLALPFSDRTGNVWLAYTAGAVYGSYFGALASLAMAAGVPVAFVPCAMGSTSIASWQPGAGSNPLFSAARDRAALVGAHKAVLWWQGEMDAITGVASQAAFAASLNNVIDSWWTQVGTPFVLVNINDQGIGNAAGIADVRAAIASVGATNTHVTGVADALGAWADGNVHYNTVNAINTMAARVSGVLGYSAAIDATAPTLSSPIGTGGVGVCSGSVSTNEANGTVYAVVTASATAPTAVQVEAGQDQTGAAALRVVSQAVTATGVQSIASSAVTAGTRYAHYTHRDAAGNRSAVASSAGFAVTAVAAPALTSSTLIDRDGNLAGIGFEAFVSVLSTGVLVVKKTSLTSSGSAVVTFSDAALTAGTAYRVVWRRTDTGAEGLETLTAA